jgi:hypothetical protein
MFNIITLRFQLVLLLILFAALAVGTGLLMANGNYEWQGLLLVILAIGTIACFLLPRMSRLDDCKSLLRILTAGLILKLGFALLLIWVGFVVYGGLVDATGYHLRGTEIAQYIWGLQFDQVVPFLQWGTDSIHFLTGVMYSVVGPTLYGGYLTYACLAFLGSYFFYRAFRMAFPQGKRRLYAVLVFFFPSILLWSNGIGKDALVFLFLGLFAYGGAQMSRGRLKGFMPLALGILGVMWIRPHVAAMLALAFIMGFLVPGLGRGTARPVISAIGFLVVGGFVWWLLPHLMIYLKIEELSLEGVLGLLQQQQSLTFGGGSAFQSVDISNPLNFPMAMVTVIFRPFFWEAHNLLAMVQSLEGVIFMGIVLWRMKSLGRALVSSLSNFYIRFILIYIIAFVVAYSAVQNFGTLVRWRTMMLPFFFMLMAYAPPDTRREPRLLEKSQFNYT